MLTLSFFWHNNCVHNPEMSLFPRHKYDSDVFLNVYIRTCICQFSSCSVCVGFLFPQKKYSWYDFATTHVLKVFSAYYSLRVEATIIVKPRWIWTLPSIFSLCWESSKPFKSRIRCDIHGIPMQK